MTKPVRNSTARVTALAALLAVPALAGCATLRGGIEPLAFQLVDFELGERSRLSQKVKLTLLVQNPNEFAVEIDGINLQLDAQGRTVARALDGERREIARLAETQIEIEATTSLFDWLRQLPGVATGGTFDYALHGTVFVVAPESQKMRIEAAGSLSEGADLRVPSRADRDVRVPRNG